MIDLDTEIQRTRPDFIAYRPVSTDRETHATGNEHFLVEKLANGTLFAVWTQSSHEGEPDQHIVISLSRDGGQHWTSPKTIADGIPERGYTMASWAFPLVSKSGRIYVIFNRHIGVNDIFTHTTGLMACLYSDDEGEHWSDETHLPMPRTIWDNPDASIPANWIVWQKPFRLSTGKYLTGMTRWVSPAVRPPRPREEWWAEAAVVEFLRFENIDADPEPQDIKITFLAQNDSALRVGLAGHPHVPAAQEPSIVELPDKRLFCVMRTTVGNPYYSISNNFGDDWTSPLPLRQYDDGPILKHPLSPCPIYRFAESEYVFFYHNHDGHFLNWTPADTSMHRRPVCLAYGRYRAGAKQPIWFAEPWFYMDHGGVPILRADLAMYSSVTASEDGIILWYPERKFFLLGKKILPKMLAPLCVTQ